MTANPVGRSVLEGIPCGGRRSPMQVVHRDIVPGATGIRVRRAPDSIAGTRTRSASMSVATADAVPAAACREADSSPNGGPAGASSGLISDFLARTTRIGRPEGRSGPKKRSGTMDCSVIGGARGGIPKHGFTRDSCHYRAQNCQPHRQCGRPSRPSRDADSRARKMTTL